MHRHILQLAGLLLFSMLCSCGGKKQVEKQPVDGVFAHPSVAVVSRAIEAEPGNAELFYKRAMALSDLESDSLALLDLKKAVTLDSGKAAYFSAIGELMFRHKDLAGSVQWFRKAIAINPKDPVAHLQFARMLVYTNDNQKAFTEINTVLRQDPYNAEAYFLKGLAYKNMEDTLKALSSFQTSVQVDPAYYESILQLGLIYSSRKDPLALKYFDNAFAVDSTDLMPLYAKGMFYQDQEDYEKAKEIYHSCIVHDPQYGDAYFNTGWILMQQDSLGKAIRQFDFVTKIEPANPEAYYNRGLCHELLKHKDAAISDYRQALEFDHKYQEPKDGLKRLGAAVPNN
jgi:tetratricopeptide (TPR) repeat protein